MSGSGVSIGSCRAWSALLWLTVLGLPWRAGGSRYRPLDYHDKDYYLSNRVIQSSSGMLENLQRGHEGLLVKLDELNKAIKEDELKLNNVFYKLGRHDTDIQSSSSTVAQLRISNRRLESKLNKHSFNVDFLRRHVEELKRGVLGVENNRDKINALQHTLDRIEEKVADAIHRISSAENGTQSMQRKGGSKSSVVNYASHSPSIEYHYLAADQAVSGSCNAGWTAVGGSCYWLSTDEAAFPEALAECVRKGGAHLASIPNQVDSHNHLKVLLRGRKYWTSATDAYTPNQWRFLLIGKPVPVDMWSNTHSRGLSYLNKHCAVLASEGLQAELCSSKFPFICEVL